MFCYLDHTSKDLDVPFGGQNYLDIIMKRCGYSYLAETDGWDFLPTQAKWDAFLENLLPVRVIYSAPNEWPKDLDFKDLFYFKDLFIYLKI